ncbi:hypothetical protein AB0I81_25750 [Nonomuraea sp. NPDC050404]|uniref:hypothetical protein n=1 Tax=Nonomuraea sp. NPDC050404 TaxID=3155783 RepID=UPI0033FCDAE4
MLRASVGALVAGLVLAVGPATQVAQAGQAEPFPTPTVTPKPVAKPLPRIVSRADGLYNEATGEAFVSRGANYTRLAKNSAGQVYHSTFEPSSYNRAKVLAFLDQMKHDGYNTVRVFIDHGTGTGEHGMGRGLGTHDKAYGPYMDTFASFVTDAAARGIYTVPSLDGFPTNSYYWGIVGDEGGANPVNMDGRNLSYMEHGRVTAKVEYVTNFATALLERIGQQYGTAILAYQSDNEVFFESNKAPFNKMTGSVTPLNGVTYHMRERAERQQAANASLVEYSLRVKRGLDAVDPDALLAMGFFSYQAVGKNGPDGFAVHCDTNCSPTTDYRYPVPAGTLSYWGAVDLLDLHMYQHHGAPVLDLHAMGDRKDPYIVGEFGAYKPHYGNDITKAAYAMRDLQRDMCRLDSSGYLFFAWDTYEPLASLDKFFQMTESGGAINGQLAPIVRPDPCG